MGLKFVQKVVVGYVFVCVHVCVAKRTSSMIKATLKLLVSSDSAVCNL
jgi:hypothetical protein